MQKVKQRSTHKRSNKEIYINGQVMRSTCKRSSKEISIKGQVMRSMKRMSSYNIYIQLTMSMFVVSDSQSIVYRSSNLFLNNKISYNMQKFKLNILKRSDKFKIKFMYWYNW